MWSGTILGFALFAVAGLGIYSFMTGKAASDLFGGVIAAITGGSSAIINVYTNYYTILTRGLQFEDWGFSILSIAVILFTMIMAMNFLTSRNRSFVQ